jgi:hypothetical protein
MKRHLKEHLKLFWPVYLIILFGGFYIFAQIMVAVTSQAAERC